MSRGCGELRPGIEPGRPLEADIQPAGNTPSFRHKIVWDSVGVGFTMGLDSLSQARRLVASTGSTIPPEQLLKYTRLLKDRSHVRGALQFSSARDSDCGKLRCLLISVDKSLSVWWPHLLSGCRDATAIFNARIVRLRFIRLLTAQLMTRLQVDDDSEMRSTLSRPDWPRLFANVPLPIGAPHFRSARSAETSRFTGSRSAHARPREHASPARRNHARSRSHNGTGRRGIRPSHGSIFFRARIFRLAWPRAKTTFYRRENQAWPDFEDGAARHTTLAHLWGDDCGLSGPHEKRPDT